MNLRDIINNNKSFAVVCHIRPDGDALGSMLALTRSLRLLGKTAFAFCDSVVSVAYAFMNGADEINSGKGQAFDVVIAVDCADILRLGEYKSMLSSAEISVNIDHHQSNTGFAKLNIVDATCASACELLFELIKQCELPMDKTIGEHLFVGIASDTGRFAHSNTTKKTFAYCAELVELGVDCARMCDMLYKQNSVEKTRLIAAAINSMMFFCEGRVAVMCLEQKDFKALNTTLDDTEGLIDYAMGVRGVLVAVCLSGASANMFKASFRSRDGIDVSRAAAVFGGGGHRQAAGCNIFGTREDVLNKTLQAVNALFE